MSAVSWLPETETVCAVDASPVQAEKEETVPDEDTTGHTLIAPESAMF